MSNHNDTRRSEWDRIGDLFERMLAVSNPEAVAAAEPDAEIRESALRLWRQHVGAERENYLGEPVEFGIAPIFSSGQILLNRFRIDRLLGTGGMGEVYLAWDERLEDWVALKTIARLLAPSRSIRKRFAAEVQSARRVTHPNVCRIHELFEDGETVFFSMEYLEGAPLSGAIWTPPIPHAREILLQMAWGLHAAHQRGVVHGDFKPGNVMLMPTPGGNAPPRAVIMDFGLARALDRAGAGPDENLSVRAGTAEYMAPELQAGGRPTVRSDIYAFGTLAAQMLPGDRLWAACTNANAEARSESLADVIDRLSPGTSRRYWIGGVVIAAAAGMEAARLLGTGGANVPAGSRVLVNGFRAAEGEARAAALVRSALLQGLAQSPRLDPIADQDLVPALRRLDPGGRLPLSGGALSGLLAELRAAFWIDGELHTTKARYTLEVRLLAAVAERAVATSIFQSAEGILALAQSAAEWIRKTVGESPASLAANPAEIARYTSQVPEALQKYYDAQAYYATANMAQAEAFLREAIRLDANFAQAHCLLGQTINAARRYDEAFREIEIALRLSREKKLPEQERLAIESVYYRATEDPALMVDVAKRNVAVRPGNPRSYAALGASLVNAGDAAGGVAALRSAVAMAPGEWMHAEALEMAMVEACDFSGALAEFEAAEARGITNSWIHAGAGAAFMGLERYEEARRAYEVSDESSQRDPAKAADVQSASVMLGQFDAALAALAEMRAAADTPVLHHRANEFLCALRFLNGREDLAREHLHEMAELAPFPPMARPLDATISWARRLGDRAALDRAQGIAQQMAARWPNGRTRSVAAHAAGAIAWRNRAFEEAGQRLLEAIGAAFSLWTLFDCAEFFTQRASWDVAEDYWDRFEARRGTVFAKSWCPAMLAWSWLYRAMAAQGRNDRPKAAKYAKKVLDHWAASHPRLPVVMTARGIHFASQA